jgi:hypothetical protein
MSFFSRVEARAYSRATEIVERVTTAILNVFPEEIRDKAKVNTTKTEGYNQVPILVISAVVADKVSSKIAADHLLKALSPGDRQAVLETLKQRLDDHCVLFVRIDKQAAYLGHLQLAAELDVISVQVQVRQYPRCVQEEAMAFIRERLAAVEG